MKNVLMFVVLCLMFSCSRRIEHEDSKPNFDSVKVISEARTELSGKSEITCPKCGFKKKETMPTDVCLLKYKCTGCRAELLPKEGDCCVFCTYGTEKCHSKQ